MTFLDRYHQDALRTEAPIVDAIERLSHPSLLRLNHAVLGLVSDLHELSISGDSTDIKEECGDLWWFLNLGMSALLRSRQELGKPTHKALHAGAVSNPVEHLSSLPLKADRDPLKADRDPLNLVSTPEGALDFMFSEAHQLADVVKARVHYGKSLFDSPEEGINITDQQVFEWMVEYRLKNITAALSYYCLFHLKVAPQVIMEANIAKLRRRFPDAYSQEKALNRDKEAERKAVVSVIPGPED